VYRTPPAIARSDEWYSPPRVLDRARQVLGRIHLDPASCARAQRLVQAVHWYRKGDGALRRTWSGQVWLNPPYSAPLLARFVRHLLAEYHARRVPAALVLVPNATDQAWCQELLAAAAVCWIRGRVAFWHQHPRQTIPGNPRGSILGYLGPHVERFVEVYSDLGTITPAGAVLRFCRAAVERRA
jgi:phage N-6-adenine-methyltransferase